MRRWFVLVAFVVGVTVPFGQVWAAIGHENELENPSFEYGGEGWEYSENVLFGEKWDRLHIAYDPMGFGESGYLRQVVDDSLFSGWDPLLNRKIGELTFWLFTTGPAYVKVGFDWWDNNDQPKPSGPGSYLLPDYHFEILPEAFTSPDQWSQVTVPFDWGGKPGNNQPRWVSIEIYFYGCVEPGYEAGVDDLSFTAQCIPEPSSLIALFGGLLSAGVILRRRR